MDIQEVNYTEIIREVISSLPSFRQNGRISLEKLITTLTSGLRPRNTSSDDNYVLNLISSIENLKLDGFIIEEINTENPENPIFILTQRFFQ